MVSVARSFGGIDLPSATINGRNCGTAVRNGELSIHPLCLNGVSEYFPFENALPTREQAAAARAYAYFICAVTCPSERAFPL